MRVSKRLILCFLLTASVIGLGGCASESAARSKTSGHSCPNCAE